MHTDWRGLLLCVALALGGAACQPASRPAPTAPTSSAPSAAAPVGPASGATGAAQPAWQVEWERTLAAARQEGTVAVYGPPGDAIRRNLVEGFRKAFPDIAVEWSPFQGGEGATKIQSERQAGIYAADILITGTTPVFTQLKPAGALDPIKPALLLPEVTDPGNWLGNRLEFSDKDGQLNLVFIATTSTLLAYDPRQARPDEVDELADLLDPKWKGKLLINEPLPGGGSANVFFRWLWHVLGPERGAEYIRALRAQAGAVDREQRRQIEWVARGRYAVATAPSDGILQQLLNEGVDVGQVVELKDRGGYLSASYGSLMLINQAPHPNAQKVFANWLLTKEGQTAYSTAMEQPSRRLDVPTDHLSPDKVPRPDGQYWPAYTEEGATIDPALTELLRSVFAR